MYVGMDGWKHGCMHVCVCVCTGAGVFFLGGTVGKEFLCPEKAACMDRVRKKPSFLSRGLIFFSINEDRV